jgi:hypothetical protein
MKKMIMFDEELKPFELKQIGGIRIIISNNNKVKKTTNQCELCTKDFETKKELKKHIKENHPL